MNYLLDTHVFLWMLSEPCRLTPSVTSAIQNPNHSVFVSAVTAVEIAIKRSLGKLSVPDHLSREISKRGLLELPLKYAHGERMNNLSPHHQAPFDRMLVAQALQKNLTLITHDRKLEPYGAKILWT